MEVWKTIKEWSDYAVSNYGRAKRLAKRDSAGHKRKERILGSYSSKGHYLQVKLSKNGVRRSFDLHRLVATYHVDNPEGKPCVNHIDGIKTNPRADNLEWCTYKENMAHAFKIGLVKEGKKHFNYGKTGERSARSKKIINTKTGKIYPSITSCFKLSGFGYAYFTEQLKGVYPNKTDFKYL